MKWKYNCFYGIVFVGRLWLIWWANMLEVEQVHIYTSWIFRKCYKIWMIGMIIYYQGRRTIFPKIWGKVNFPKIWYLVQFLNPKFLNPKNFEGRNPKYTCIHFVHNLTQSMGTRGGPLAYGEYLTKEILKNWRISH